MAYKNPQDQRDAWNRWYKKNHAKAKMQRKKNQEERETYVRDLKERTPCADCNRFYPSYVMDFDHIDGKKVSSVSHMAAREGWLRLMAEIAKCEIVCSNCHRIRTHSKIV